MNEIVIKDIIAILNDAIDAAKRGDAGKLKELSDHTIHNASIFQDEHSISSAVIIYSISKILEHSSEHNHRFLVLLESAREKIKANDEKGFKHMTKELMDLIGTIDSRFSHFVDDVIRHASIKKGIKLYEHGISMGHAADMLGISQWELMDYVGRTKTEDRFYDRPDTIEKIKFTRRLFNGPEGG